MTVVLAIDPGSERSAWLGYEPGRVIAHGIVANDELLDRLRSPKPYGTSWVPIPGDELDTYLAADLVVIEQIESYGMAVGREVFETVRWSGRFEEALHPVRVEYLPRRAVKLHLCGSPKAKDANIRQALIDRFGGAGGKAAAVGVKASPGPLYGLRADLWAALAVAVTWVDQEGSR